MVLFTNLPASGAKHAFTYRSGYGIDSKHFRDPAGLQQSKFLRGSH